MHKQLPGAWDLIVESWSLFTTHWNQTIKISIWFLYFGLAEFFVYLMMKITPFAGFMLLPLSLAMIIVSVWISIRLSSATLKLVDKKSLGDETAENAKAWNLFLPFIWVGILQFLITMGGFLLLIIPGIYLAISLAFAQLIVIDQGKRGLDALGASRELVRGRWWSVFWRMLLGSLIIGVAVLLIQMVVSGMFALLVGPNNFMAMLQSEDADPLFNGTLSLLSSIMQAAVLPLFFAFHAKVYRALQKSE